MFKVDISLTNAQLRKLAQGHKVRLSHHSIAGPHHHHTVFLTDEQHKKYSSAVRRGKGMELQFSPSQIEHHKVHGSGLFDSIKSGIGKVGSVLAPVGSALGGLLLDEGKSIAKDLIKEAVSPIKENIKDMIRGKPKEKGGRVKYKGKGFLGDILGFGVKSRKPSANNSRLLAQTSIARPTVHGRGTPASWGMVDIPGATSEVYRKVKGTGFLDDLASVGKFIATDVAAPVIKDVVRTGASSLLRGRGVRKNISIGQAVRNSKIKGAGFFDDFVHGFTSVVKPAIQIGVPLATQALLHGGRVKRSKKVKGKGFLDDLASVGKFIATDVAAPVIKDVVRTGASSLLRGRGVRRSRDSKGRFKRGGSLIAPGNGH